MTKSIVLLSGGLDSSLALIKTQGLVVPMFVDYNQSARDKELRAVKEFLEQSGVCDDEREDLVIVKMDLGDDYEVESAWGRTIAMVGLAAMWAYTHGDDIDWIVTGLHQGDVGPDCAPGDFTHLLNQTLNVATKGQIGLSLPIRDLTVEDIGKELLGLEGLDYDPDTFYTCYWDPPCGYKSPNDTYRCPGCRRKKIAMEAAGIRDEKLLDFPNGIGGARSYQSPLATPVGY